MNFVVEVAAKKSVQIAVKYYYTIIIIIIIIENVLIYGFMFTDLILQISPMLIIFLDSIFFFFQR